MSSKTFWAKISILDFFQFKTSFRNFSKIFRLVLSILHSKCLKKNFDSFLMIFFQNSEFHSDLKWNFFDWCYQNCICCSQKNILRFKTFFLRNFESLELFWTLSVKILRCRCQNSILRVHKNFLGVILFLKIFGNIEEFLDFKEKKFNWCRNFVLYVQKNSQTKNLGWNFLKSWTFFSEFQQKFCGWCCQCCILRVLKNSLLNFCQNFSKFWNLLSDLRWIIFGCCCENFTLGGLRNILHVNIYFDFLKNTEVLIVFFCNFKWKNFSWCCLRSFLFVCFQALPCSLTCRLNIFSKCQVLR